MPTQVNFHQKANQNMAKNKASAFRSGCVRLKHNFSRTGVVSYSGRHSRNNAGLKTIFDPVSYTFWLGSIAWQKFKRKK
jgi:hypothetical protein